MSDKGKPLDETEVKLMHILDNHKGADQAIAARVLAELTELNPRRMRSVINHLVIEHGIPVGSIAGGGGGYFLIATADEGKRFYRSFRRRGMTGITKAARLLKVSPLEGAVQLVLDFAKENKKISGTAGTIKKLLEIYRSNPEVYDKEIAALKGDPMFVDSDHMAQINKAAQDAGRANKRLEELTQAAPGVD